MTDHYRLLQVRRDASVEVISAAYKRLMRSAHPDHGGSAERARQLNLAFETLSDPAMRAAYDRTLTPEHGAPHRELLPKIAYRFGRGLGRLARAYRGE